MIDAIATRVGVRRSPYIWSEGLALNEVCDQETDKICSNVGSKEVVLVLRGPIGPRRNLWWGGTRS